jgi:hypothetical protein
MTLQAANTPRIVEINHDSLQLFSDSQAECRGFDSLRPLHRSKVSGPDDRLKNWLRLGEEII